MEDLRWRRHRESSHGWAGLLRTRSRTLRRCTRSPARSTSTSSSRSLTFKAHRSEWISEKWSGPASPQPSIQESHTKKPESGKSARAWSRSRLTCSSKHSNRTHKSTESKDERLPNTLRAKSIGSLALRALSRGDSTVAGTVVNTFANSFYARTDKDELLFLTNHSIRS